MIISCIKCIKKFEINSDLIPENGRLLQCNSCNHKWFFIKKIINEPAAPDKINKPKEIKPFKEEIDIKKTEITETIELLDTSIDVLEKIVIKTKAKNGDDTKPKVKKFTNKNNFNILSKIIVFIISFIALIIVLDTFQKPISNIVPNIEFLLYNFYETINDFVLFFSDLI